MSKQAKAKVQVAQVNTNDVDAHLETIATVSGKIRYLASTGMTRGAIAKKLNKRYQHVRNVLEQPLKKIAE